MMRYLIITCLTTAAILPGFSECAAAKQAPIPEGTQLVFLIRPSLVIDDPQLGPMVPDLAIVDRYLALLNLTLGQVVDAVVFTPFDAAWTGASGRHAPEALSPQGGFVITGRFDAGKEYAGLKKKGWREKQYMNKKILWWSKGEPYLLDPGSNQCLAKLDVDQLLVAGSEDQLKAALDVAGGKRPGMETDSIYSRVAGQFSQDSSTAMSFYALITDDIRALLKPDSAAMKSSGLTVLSGLMEYSNHVTEAGISIAKGNLDYLTTIYLAMDSENSAVAVSGLLQVGSSLASLMPPDDPNRTALAGLKIVRDHSLVRIHSKLTRQQLGDMVRPHK